MNEEHFNMQMRKFLKQVGVTSQTEIEKAVRSALYDGRIAEDATIKATMTLEIPTLGTVHKVEALIELKDEDIEDEHRHGD
ncbi:MAG TPA: hypothetical protein DCG48_04655 [Rhodospirillaceae bacterium]|nr:hypothetical protein [Rhodospirillaceae bacterium]